MYYYAIYLDTPLEFKQGSLPVEGIYGPYSSEDRAMLKLAELQEGGGRRIPLEVHMSLESSPREAMEEYKKQERAKKIGGQRLPGESWD